MALVSGLLTAIVLAGMGTFVYLRLGAELMATVDSGLRSRAEVLGGGSSGAGSTLPAAPDSGTALDPGVAFVQVVGPDGRVVASSADLAPGPVLPADAVAGLEGARFFDTDVTTVEEPVPARVLAVPRPGGDVLLVGAAVEDQQEAVNALAALLGVAGLAALALTGGVGWIVAGAALRPVERMRVEAEAVSGSDPGRRLPVPESGDELARLGESLNRMLGRMEDAMEHERRFVDDASHELRTPLANLRAELELAGRGPQTVETLDAAVRSATEETERLIRLAEDLLVLARSDRGLALHREEADIATLVSETADSFAARASDLGVALDVSAPASDVAAPDVAAPGRGGPAPVRVDGPRLRQAVANLVDNALRHTPRGGTVSIEVSGGSGPGGEPVSIVVADTGPGFDPAFLPQAFEPFSRADASRARDDGGSGLGLAIVRAVVEAHGGSVDAANRVPAGAVVTLRIPG